ncbi:hypothetical protein QOT17_010242 [Balamuthia mandrillaris]
MWHAYNLISEGDLVRATTVRRVQERTTTGTSKSERVRMTLTIQVEKIEFDTDSGVLRLNGTNRSENEYVRVCIFSLYCFSSLLCEFSLSLSLSLSLVLSLSLHSVSCLPLSPSRLISCLCLFFSPVADCFFFFLLLLPLCFTRFILFFLTGCAILPFSFQMGAYHTLDLEMNRKFILTKRYWDSVALERIDIACDPTKYADLAAVIMTEGLATVCLINSSMTIVLPFRGNDAALPLNTTRFLFSSACFILVLYICILLSSFICSSFVVFFLCVLLFSFFLSILLSLLLSLFSFLLSFLQSRASSHHLVIAPMNTQQGLKKFFEATMQAILRHINFDVVKCVIIASPGFVKDQFNEYMTAEAIKRELKVLMENKDKFVLAHSTSGHKHALREILTDPLMQSKLEDTKAAGEVRVLAQFYEMMKIDPDRAFYGLSDVVLAQDRLAIETLLLTDELFRASDIATRKKYVNLVESVKALGGNVQIFSTLHVSGEQLKQLGGIAAILRFPLPDVAGMEDEEDEDEEDEDEEEEGEKVKEVEL